MNQSNYRKTILSLCDYSGRWALPYAEAGYRVVLVDPKFAEKPTPPMKGIDGKWAMTAQELLASDACMSSLIGNVHGVLAAPPCTDFSVSGAQYWKAKDADGRTAASVEVVQACLAIIWRVNPVWWALENPVGRLPKLVPYLGKPWYFQPHWYGDPWTKKTGLWGTFNRDLPRNDVEPIRYTKQGSWTQRYGGKSERTKEARSMTPLGFARAFFQANP